MDSVRRVCEEVVLIVKDEEGSVPTFLCSSICLCRICHEEEEVSSGGMETPCSCSGTLKFAHRGCVQRWCDEKGSTLCEICLQNFEPGYTVAPKKALVDMGVTIRESLEVPRQGYDPLNSSLIIATNSSDEEYAADVAQCSPASERSVSWCRTAAVTVTIVLLLRHLMSVVAAGADQYAFTLFTVFILRASGILLPLFVLMKIFNTVQEMQRRHRRWNRRQHLRQGTDDLFQQGGRPLQHTVQIR